MKFDFDPEIFDALTSFRTSSELAKQESYITLEKMDKVFKKSKNIWESIPAVFQASLYSTALLDQRGVDDDKREKIQSTQNVGLLAMAAIEKAYRDCLSEQEVQKLEA